MIKLSIIIPVYNVEEYVEKCIVSCAEQDLPSSSYEIIVVNDGSKDKSLEKVENLAERYDNISVTSQPNAGPSAARNTGLSLVRGEYIWFVDADDWIEANCLRSITGRLNGIDVLAMGYRFIENGTTSIVRVSNESAKTGRELLLSPIFLANPFYIYKKTFLERSNLHFELGLLHEDFEFVPRMLYCAETIDVYSDIVYNYFKREGSITTSVNPKKSFDLIKIAGIFSDFTTTKVAPLYKQRFCDFISVAINNSLSNSLMMCADDKRALSEMLCKRKSLFSALRNSSRAMYRIEGVLFSLFPGYCLETYSLLSKVKKYSPFKQFDV